MEINGTAAVNASRIRAAKRFRNIEIEAGACLRLPSIFIPLCMDNFAAAGI